jgi:hypothetical protein
MKTETDTPRTNASCFSATTEKSSSGDYELEVVYADFARKLERENAVLRQALQMIADESERHHEHNMVSGKDRLPKGYVTIRNIACDTLKI